MTARSRIEQLLDELPEAQQPLVLQFLEQLREGMHATHAVEDPSPLAQGAEDEERELPEASVQAINRGLERVARGERGLPLEQVLRRRVARHS